jgi:hypothetical protein
MCIFDDGTIRRFPPWRVEEDEGRIIIQRIYAMAYDEGVAERLREVFIDRDDVIENKMFGGVAFMHRGNMCCGIVGDILMARVGPTNYEAALRRPHAREMDFTGKSMQGFVYVDPDGFAEDNELREWIALCEEFTGALPAK